jgi:hypothetical protein
MPTCVRVVVRGAPLFGVDFRHSGRDEVPPPSVTWSMGDMPRPSGAPAGQRRERPCQHDCRFVGSARAALRGPVGIDEDSWPPTLVVAIRRPTSSDDGGVHHVALPSARPFRGEQGTKDVVGAGLGHPGLGVQPIVDDARPSLRIVPRVPARHLLCPPRHGRPIRRESDGYLDPFSIPDLHDQRVTENPESVIAHEYRLTNGGLDPINTVESVRSLHDLRRHHQILRSVSIPRCRGGRHILAVMARTVQEFGRERRGRGFTRRWWVRDGAWTDAWSAPVTVGRRGWTSGCGSRVWADGSPPGDAAVRVHCWLVLAAMPRRRLPVTDCLGRQSLVRIMARAWRGGRPGLAPGLAGHQPRSGWGSLRCCSRTLATVR